MRFGSFDFVTFIRDVLCVCVCVCDVTKLSNVFSAQKVSKKFVSHNTQLLCYFESSNASFSD